MNKNGINKKRVNYVLIPSVILVWGFIAFKIVSFYKLPAEEPAVLSNKNFPIDSSLKDTIFMYADYRDPFKQSSLQKAPIVKPEEQIKPIEIKAKSVVSWPELSYEGSIKGKGEKVVALITVQDKKFVAGKNMEITGIRIMDIYTDSLKVSFQKELKTITK